MPSSALDTGSIDHFDEHGYVVVEDVIDSGHLAAAQAALEEHYPTPDTYFADPARFAWLGESQFAGLTLFPWRSFALNRLTVDPGLVDAVRQLLRVDDIRLCKSELWAKYGGAVDYDQEHHRDFGNHTLTVPRRDGTYREATTFVFLSDVTAESSPPALVPRAISDAVPYGVMRAAPGAYRDDEVHITGKAGSALIYAYDLFHRGTSMRDPHGYRFIVLADYRDARASWIGKHAFGTQGLNRDMAEFLSRIDPAQRELMDFPRPGHPYWNQQTLDDCALRYPDMDMAPYCDAVPT